MSFASHEHSRRSFLRYAGAIALTPLVARAGCPCNDDANAPASTTQPTGQSTGQPAGTQPADTLRVCTDPNNFPFSNRTHEGFEDRIACMIASDLGLFLQFDYLPQRLGFFRTAFKTFHSNVTMAAPIGFDMALVTRPYYRSTYVFVTRDKTAAPANFGDAALRKMKIGIPLAGTGTPAAHALARRGIIDNITGYPVFDETNGKPGENIVAAVASGEIDVAIAWGPQVGYFARHSTVPLNVTPVTPAVDGQGKEAMPFTFEIGMAVNRADKPLVEKLNTVLVRRQKEIDAILDDYAVPRLDMKGQA